jgi:hypothetical protein
MVNVGLTWSGRELPSSRRGDLTVAGSPSDSGTIIEAINREVCKREDALQAL